MIPSNSPKERRYYCLSVDVTSIVSKNSCKTQVFEGSYAHPGPSLLGKRQGQYGVCRADSTVARTLWQTGPTPRIKGRGKGACSACMQRPQRRQHARTSGSGSEPGARTGMVEGHAKSTPCTRPRQVPAARDRQKVLREGRGELPALLLRSPAFRAYRRAPYSQACIQERQVRHSQAMARLPDTPEASRPAGQAEAHLPTSRTCALPDYPERDKACKKRKECPCRTQIPAPEAWPHALEDCQDKPEDKHEGSRPEGTLLNLQIEKVCGMRCLKKRRKRAPIGWVLVAISTSATKRMLGLLTSSPA